MMTSRLLDGMSKIFGISFVTLLIAIHYGEAVDGDVYSRPLSMFRDVEPQWVGNLLFGLLLCLGFSAVRTALRVKSELDAVFYGLTTLSMGYIACTPSYTAGHNLCAFATMGIMYCYFLIRLFATESFLVWWAHMAAPMLILWLTKAGSYGIWQKSVIVYFVVVIVVHEHIMASWILSASPPKRAKRQSGRRKVRVVVARANPNQVVSEGNVWVSRTKYVTRETQSF